MQAWKAASRPRTPKPTCSTRRTVPAPAARPSSAAAQFAGSDAYLDDESGSGPEGCGPDGAMDIPVYVSPIAVAFNLPGINEIKMDAETIAKIFRGEITKWNDQAIASQNQGVDLPDTSITVVHRSDKSGTTENFMDYLSAAARKVWTDKASGDWPAELKGENAKGTSGVVSTTSATNGAMTYADASAVGDLGTVKVKVGNEYFAHSPEAAAKAVEVATPVEGRDAMDMSLNLDRKTEESGTYPIVLVSYHIVCSTYADQDTVDLVKAFGSYVISEDGQKTAQSRPTTRRSPRRCVRRPEGYRLHLGEVLALIEVRLAPRRRNLTRGAQPCSGPASWPGRGEPARLAEQPDEVQKEPKGREVTQTLTETGGGRTGDKVFSGHLGSRVFDPRRAVLRGAFLLSGAPDPWGGHDPGRRRILRLHLAARHRHPHRRCDRPRDRDADRDRRRAVHSALRAAPARPGLGYVVDLLAAIPSVVYGAWGVAFLARKSGRSYNWLAENMGWMPIFPGPASATGKTMLTAGIVLVRDGPADHHLAEPRDLPADAQAARGGRAGLGATRWEMIRMTVLPFARPGIISAVMLGLGRALGETMAVALVLSSGALIASLIQSGNQTIAAEIALNFPEA